MTILTLDPAPAEPDGPDQPVRRPAAPPVVLARALGAGALAAALFPGSRLGAGTVVGAVALAAATPSGRRWRTPLGLAFAVVATGLVTMAAVRDADWLVALCLTAALATWSLLLSGGATFPATLFGAVVVPLRLPAAVPWLLRPLAGLGTAERRDSLLPALRGSALALLLVGVFGGLFVTADAAFRDLVGRVLPDLDALSSARVVVLVAAASLVGAAALVAAAPAIRGTVPPYTGRVLRPVEWVLPLLVLDLLFAAFVTVQLTVLFGGRDHVLSTAGLTYAEYARQGFGQLVAAAVLTLVVVAVTVRRTPRSDRLAKALLAVLCLLALVVLASASRRLGLYEQEFGFTRLRLSVDGAIGWLAVVLLLVLAAGVRARADWLPRAVVLSAAGGLLLFAAGDPDARIAERNVERFAATGELDLGYLAGLSADAVPALQRLPEPGRSCVLRAIGAPPPDAWHAENLSRVRAREAFTALPPGPCTLSLRPRPYR